MDSLKQNIEDRINLYGLVSRLMITEVDSDFINAIEKDEAIMEMMPNFRDWSKKKEIEQDELIQGYYNADYASMFLMHMVPYESFYTRDDQMIESGGDNPVVALYNALDFRVETSAARVVSADHIGVELEFMYMLCDALKKAIEADDKEGVVEILKVQEGFLKDHLLNWAPMFLINVKKESRTPLYHDGAELTLEFLLSDYEYVTSVIKDLEN
ncbi:MAG: molecular chaperone TorD family protein [Campylobacterales bacterium]|nr:molecular chaperone TorD family protein [Campylobacterales bacterium]